MILISRSILLLQCHLAVLGRLSKVLLTDKIDIADRTTLAIPSGRFVVERGVGKFGYCSGQALGLLVLWPIRPGSSAPDGNVTGVKTATRQG